MKKRKEDDSQDEDLENGSSKEYETRKVQEIKEKLKQNKKEEQKARWKEKVMHDQISLSSKRKHQYY